MFFRSWWNLTLALDQTTPQYLDLNIPLLLELFVTPNLNISWSIQLYKLILFDFSSRQYSWWFLQPSFWGIVSTNPKYTSLILRQILVFFLFWKFYIAQPIKTPINSKPIDNFLLSFLDYVDNYICCTWMYFFDPSFNQFSKFKYWSYSLCIHRPNMFGNGIGKRRLSE